MNYKISHLEPFGVLVEPINNQTSVKELDIEKLRDLFRQKQLVLLRGFDNFEASDDFADYCENWGEISIYYSKSTRSDSKRRSRRPHI